MNLDPVDIFGETIGEPIKRVSLYFLAAVCGGWTGEIAMNVEHGEWHLFGWNEIANGFLWPLGILFSSAGPLLVGGLVFFLVAPWRLDWPWILASAGASASVLAHGEAGFGWTAWAFLNAGLAGAVWMHSAYRHARWARELTELKAENAIRNAMRGNAPACKGSGGDDEPPDDG